MDQNKDYIGRVVYNEDPTFTGRCKIRVFGLFDELDTEAIPWFTPANYSIFSSTGAGSISVPKLDSIVRVRFQRGDVYSGEYYALQTLDPNLATEIKDDYQGTHVLLYDSEKDLIVTYQPQTGFKIYLGGSLIKVDSDGTILLQHRNNSNVVEVNERDINIVTAKKGGSNVSGNINITAGSTVNITAPTVNVKSDAISLGNNATSSAVKGDKLVGVLKQIVTELGTKFPQSASPLVGKTFSEILSSDVKIQ